MAGFRLRRTLLFVPGDRPDRVKKASRLGADGVIMDLEDAVSPERKALAREAVRQALEEIEFGQRERIVRINGITTIDGVRDLAALKEFKTLPDAVVAPKVESAGEVRILDALLAQMGSAIELIVVAESAKGVLAAREIAAASPRVTAIIFGGADLSAGVGCPMAWDTLLHSRNEVLLAAAAAGIDAIDVPYMDLEDEKGLEEETSRIARMGFSGKAVVHPRQIDAVNRVFSPSEEDLAWADRILEAFSQGGSGAMRVDGKLVDAPVIKRAQKIAAAAARLRTE